MVVSKKCGGGVVRVMFVCCARSCFRREDVVYLFVFGVVAMGAKQIHVVQSTKCETRVGNEK